MPLLCSTKPWDADTCLLQFEKDSIIQTKQRQQRRRHNGYSYSRSWATQQKVNTSNHLCGPACCRCCFEWSNNVIVVFVFLCVCVCVCVCVCTRQAQVNGKHRKSSSQPSSCSQNTESSSSTPEPPHGSSDNEGEDTHTHTHTHTHQ